MNRDREIKKANGQYLHLEVSNIKPSILIKNGIVVNEEGYKIWLERQKQNKYVPTGKDLEMIKEKAKDRENQELEIEREKNKKLEERLNNLEALINKKNG